MFSRDLDKGAVGHRILLGAVISSVGGHKGSCASIHQRLMVAYEAMCRCVFSP